MCVAFYDVAAVEIVPNLHPSKWRARVRLLVGAVIKSLAFESCEITSAVTIGDLNRGDHEQNVGIRSSVDVDDISTFRRSPGKVKFRSAILPGATLRGGLGGKTETAMDR